MLHCKNYFAGVLSDDIHEDPTTIKQTLVLSYRSKIDEGLKAELREIDNHLQDGLEDKQLDRWATTWWQQCSVLFRRGVKERRHESFSGLKIGQVLVVGFLSGLLWWQSDSSHLQDQVRNPSLTLYIWQILSMKYCSTWKFFAFFWREFGNLLKINSTLLLYMVMDDAIT